MFFKYFFAMLIALNLSHAYAEDKENYLKNHPQVYDFFYNLLEKKKDHLLI